MRPPFLYNQNNLYTILILSLLILTLSLYGFLYNFRWKGEENNDSSYYFNWFSSLSAICLFNLYFTKGW